MDDGWLQCDTSIIDENETQRCGNLLRSRVIVVLNRSFGALIEGHGSVFCCDLRDAMTFCRVSNWWICEDYMLRVGVTVSNLYASN